MVRNRRWGRIVVQDVENASFPFLLDHGDRDRLEIDHLLGLRCLLANPQTYYVLRCV